MHKMFGIHLGDYLENSPRILGWIQFLLLVPILYWNRSWFVNGSRALLHFAPTMDTLVCLGSGAGALYSLLRLLSLVPGNPSELFFEASGMVLVLVTFGKYLEGRTKRHASDAIAKLVRLAPETASVERTGKEFRVKVAEILTGDVVLMRAGESVPVDGIVLDGRAAVDESAVTGESVPVAKMPGDKVIAGTVNTEGFFKFKAENVGKDTTLAKIIALVSEAGTGKMRASRIADRVSAWFVPAVIAVALLAFSLWLLSGATFSFALSIGITVLLISCPCALGLATPLAVMAGTGRGAEYGVLFRGGEALETLGRVTVMVFDKTGTLTKGQPSVEKILPADDVAAEELLQCAASLESKSQHPFAKAVLECAKTKNIPPEKTEDFRLIPGRGIAAKLSGDECVGGNAEFLEEHGWARAKTFPAAAEFALQGMTVLYFAKGNKFLGALVMTDEIREDSAETISKLRSMGVMPVMVTGDNRRTAQSVAAKLGIERVEAEVLPQDKERILRSFKDKGGITAMVGDGINDAPALARADVGIAVGGGTDIAAGSADVLFMHNGLYGAVNAVQLSRAVVRNIHVNLFWAFAYNVLAIPLAAGLLYPWFGLLLHPVVGAAAMSASSLCVVTNALRLRFRKLE